MEDFFTQELLKYYSSKQPFRISKGKSTWYQYDTNITNVSDITLREILKDEIIIEVDDTLFYKNKKEFSDEVINFFSCNLNYHIPKIFFFLFQSFSQHIINLTSNNLKKDNITFEVWNHGGKSPHLHIHNIPIAHLSKDELKIWKESFIDCYVPSEYLIFADKSLCGVHLVALEGVKHWKGKYEIKKLLHYYNPTLKGVTK
ncbi:hypothetical protein GOV12_02265 [Candidatus Pacearchaeota archaeon]|nr:hypothetical protein [Candidatus Pacearchaeota archaeon]